MAVKKYSLELAANLHGGVLADDLYTLYTIFVMLELVASVYTNFLVEQVLDRILIGQTSSIYKFTYTLNYLKLLKYKICKSKTTICI